MDTTEEKIIERMLEESYAPAKVKEPGATYLTAGEIWGALRLKYNNNWIGRTAVGIILRRLGYPRRQTRREGKLGTYYRLKTK